MARRLIGGGVWVMWAMVGGAAGCRTGPGTADLVLVNARIWTGDEGRPEAAALAVRGGRIMLVGEEAEVRALAGPRTRTLDARGRRVIPGLADAHLHFVSGGLTMTEVDLRPAVDRADFVERVAARAREIGPGKWVLGGRWTVDSWADPSPPRKEWIDAVTAENPAYLPRSDGHMGLVNSAALRLAGITREGPADPTGGVIDRDAATGEPTGLLRDAAMDLVSRHIPAPSAAELDAALERATRHAHRNGLTAVHDMSEWSHIETYARAARARRLGIRVYSFFQTPETEEALRRIAGLGRTDEEWFRVGGVKAYMDGSLGARTAYMSEPYPDNAPERAAWRGLLDAAATPPEQMTERCVAVDKAGLQTAVHAIGEEANRLLLETYAAVGERNGERARRMRIEHAQHVRVEDIPRFAQLGVIASMQPFHKADDGRWADRVLSARQLRGTYAWRSLLESGATVSFGSDWPVVTLNPFVGIAAAVTGRTTDGKLWLAEQNLTVEQALRCYTMGAARASFAEERLGSLAAGKAADFVVLDRDILRCAPGEIDQTRAMVTVVGGEVRWSADGE